MQEIEIVIDPQGETTISWNDLLEDYWYDFLSFRDEASASQKIGDLCRTRRYLRSSLFAFLNYLSGLTNRWQATIDETEQGSASASPIYNRLVHIAHRFDAQHPPKLDIDFLADLAERCSNLQPSDEKSLLDDLSFQQIGSSVDQIVTWLGDFVRLSGLPLHSKVKSSAFEYANAIGHISKDEYQCFESLRDDPLAFQDPPGTWEDYQADRESSRESN